MCSDNFPAPIIADRGVAFVGRDGLGSAVVVNKRKNQGSKRKEELFKKPSMVIHQLRGLCRRP